MSDTNLRASIIRIASELPKGDATRRELLALVSDKEGASGAARYIQSAIKDLNMALRTLQHPTNPDWGDLEAFGDLGNAVRSIGRAVHEIEPDYTFANELDDIADYMQRTLEA